MSPHGRARHSLVTRRVTVALGAACLLLAGLIVPAAVSTAQAGPNVQPRNGGTPTTTYAIIKTVDPGVRPLGVAVDDIDDTIYVANYGNNSGSSWRLASINGRSGAVTPSTVGKGASGVAVDQEDDSIYVTNNVGNSMSFYQGRTMTPFASLSLQDDSGPFGVTVDQNDDTVYVTSYLTNSLLIINGRTRTLDDTVTVGGRPTGVAVDNADDTVYVVSELDDSVMIINGRTLAPVGGGVAVGDSPQGVAIDQLDDTVYVTNYTSGSVSVIAGRPGVVSGAPILVGSGPEGIAVDQDDDTVYVVNSLSNSMSMINGRTGMRTDDTISVGSAPRGVAVDGAGTNKGLVYVTSFNSNTLSTIARVSPVAAPATGSAGDVVTVTANVANLASGYSMDDSTILQITVDGTPVSTIFRVAGQNQWQFNAPAGSGTVPVDVTFRGGLTASAGTFTYATPPPPPPPPPPPVFPPSAPLSVAAVGGDAQATLTWAAPADSGSFPVTNYEVRSIPPGGTCAIAALTCTMPGLTNGTAYSFEARAFNGAGWGPWSTPSNTVTPTAPPPPPPPPPTPSITITGSRGTGAERQVVFVTGASNGLDGEQVRAYVKLRGQTDYRPGRLVDLDAEGRFTWQRTTGRKAYIYFSGNGVQSNRVIIPAA